MTRLTLALVVGVLATGCSSSNSPRPRSQSATTTAPPTTTTAVLTPGPDAPPEPAVERVGRIALPITPRALLVSGPNLYAFGEPLEGAFTIVRVATRGGAVLSRTSLSGRYVSAAASPTSLYVQTARDQRCCGDQLAPPYRLRRLDAKTLRLLAESVLRTSASTVVARGDGIYVVDDDRIERRDPETLDIVDASQLPKSTSADLSSDPRSSVVWIALAGPPDNRLTVVEVETADVRSRHVLRTAAMTESMLGGSVSAAADGAWVSFPTGLRSDAVRVAARSGAETARVGFRGPNSASYVVAGERLWIQANPEGLGCASAVTGELLGISPVNAPIAAATDAVFAGSDHAVEIYRPVGRCAD